MSFIESSVRVPAEAGSPVGFRIGKVQLGSTPGGADNGKWEVK